MLKIHSSRNSRSHSNVKNREQILNCSFNFCSNVGILCKVFMAKCKYCGAEISRLDKDNCPFCGGRKPLEGMDDSTQDMTKSLAELNIEAPKQKSKLIAAILAFTLGMFGVHSYYLGKYKIGLIILAITLGSIGGVGSILYFAIMHNVFGYLIPLFVMEAIMICVGVSILVRHDVRDNTGEFLK